MLALGPATVLEIPQDRRTVGRAGPREHLPNEVSHLRWRRIPLRRRDSGAFVKDRVDESRARSSGSNLTSSGPDQRCDRRRRGKAAKLRPHLGEYVIAYGTRDATGGKSGLDRLAARRALSAQLAKRGLPDARPSGRMMSPLGDNSARSRDTPPSTRWPPK
jgi:hypothetical protein